MLAKAELMQLMRKRPIGKPREEVDRDPVPAAAPGLFDYDADPLLAPPTRAAEAAARSAADAAENVKQEMKRWLEDDTFNGRTMLDFWTSDQAASLYPHLHYVFPHLVVIEQSNAGCERDFSVLARLLTPLRKGRMKMQTVERKMFLSLNQDYWHPLPDRQEEKIVQDALARFKVELGQGLADEEDELIKCDLDEDLSEEDDDDFFIDG